MFLFNCEIPAGPAKPARSGMKKISVITGVFNEESTVLEVYEHIKGVLSKLTNYEYEHIFMDNASTDNTFHILTDIAKKDNNVKVVNYSKNIGALKTEMIGYWLASGDAVIGYEANLKDPAELILKFIEKWEEGYKVVYGVRTRTSDNFFLLTARRIFYRLLSLLSDEPLPLDAGTFRLVDRAVVNEIVKLRDYKPYMRGLVVSCGFRQTGIFYERNKRPRGRSKTNFAYLVDYAINAFVSYSIKPIRFCTYLGVLLSSLSLLLSIAYAIAKLIYWQLQAPGIATVIVLILFFQGIQLIFLGVIGEYVGAIHSQVRAKPFAIIDKTINIDIQNSVLPF